MNYGTVAGHLGNDPETRFTAQGQKVTTFRVGCRARKNETVWWRVTIWGDQFDKMLVHVKKGSSLIIMGEITKPEIFTDREGKAQVSMQITASYITFTPSSGGKGKEEGGFQKKSDGFGGNSGGFDEGGMSHSFGGEKEEAFSDEEIPF